MGTKSNLAKYVCLGCGKKLNPRNKVGVCSKCLGTPAWYWLKAPRTTLDKASELLGLNVETVEAVGVLIGAVEYVQNWDYVRAYVDTKRLMEIEKTYRQIGNGQESPLLPKHIVKRWGLPRWTKRLEKMVGTPAVVSVDSKTKIYFGRLLNTELLDKIRFETEQNTLRRGLSHHLKTRWKALKLLTKARRVSPIAEYLVYLKFWNNYCRLEPDGYQLKDQVLNLLKQKFPDLISVLYIDRSKFALQNYKPRNYYDLWEVRVKHLPFLVFHIPVPLAPNWGTNLTTETKTITDFNQFQSYFVQFRLDDLNRYFNPRRCYEKLTEFLNKFGD